MQSGTLLLDIRRAQAEATSRALSNWSPPTDIDQRIRQVEESIREFLDVPRELKQVVHSVFENQPHDGSLLSYMNDRRTELTACFQSALGGAAQLRELAWGSETGGRSVPSLPLLERAIREVEQLQSNTLAHWVEFDANEQIGDEDDYISHEEFLGTLASQMSEEARRELQNRLASVGR